MVKLSHQAACLDRLPNLKLKALSVNNSLPQVVLWVNQEFSLKMGACRVTQQTYMVKLATTLSKLARLIEYSHRKLTKRRTMIKICQYSTSQISGQRKNLKDLRLRCSECSI